MGIDLLREHLRTLAVQPRRQRLTRNVTPHPCIVAHAWSARKDSDLWHAFQRDWLRPARTAGGDHAGSADGSCPAATAGPYLAGRLAGLERKYEARLGVCVLAIGPTAVIAYRADERFAFRSTFKAPLAAAVLQKNPVTHLDTVITYTSADIRSTSPITEQHVETGMTVGQLCDAAIRYSDGTAANLLLTDIGGTAAFTRYLRGLGDTVSRLDQEEPELNRDAPVDQRDTNGPCSPIGWRTAPRAPSGSGRDFPPIGR
jgi:Beta-lactamase enzyme family